MRNHLATLIGPIVGLVLCVPQAPWASDAASAATRDVPAADIDAIFAQWDRSDSPGVVVAVIDDGQMIYSRGYGMANLEHDIPLSPESVFYIASTSKQFAAASIALLVQRGQVSLDDSVRKFYPELPAYATPIKVRHLVHHTSGVRDYLALLELADRGTADFGLDDAIRLTRKQRELNFKPGDEWLYSNSNYVLISGIVEVVTGKSLRQFAHENIFGPLGMTHSLFRDDHTLLIEHRATGYAAASDGFRSSDPAIETVGGGNLWTTVGDLARWDQNFYEPKVGGSDFLEMIQTPGKLNDGTQLEYAFGLNVTIYRGQKCVDHGGAFMGFRAQMMRLPEQRFTVICLANLASVVPDALCRRVADLYLSDVLDPVPDESAAATGQPAPTFIDVTAADLERLAGAYQDTTSRLIWQVSVADNGLDIQTAGPIRFRARPVGDGRFRSIESPTKFVCQFDMGEGRPELQVTRENQSPRRFVPVEAVTLTEDDLASYVGRFYSDEIDATYLTLLEGGALYVQRPRGARLRLKPTVRDEFIAGGLRFNFRRVGEGLADGFHLSTPRARNVRFVWQQEYEEIM